MDTFHGYKVGPASQDHLIRHSSSNPLAENQKRSLKLELENNLEGGSHCSPFSRAAKSVETKKLCRFSARVSSYLETIQTKPLNVRRIHLINLHPEVKQCASAAN